MIALVALVALVPLDLVDLTHTLGPASPAWPDAPHVAVKIEADYPQGYFARHVSMPEHSGTHVDAPAHFARGGATVDAIAPSALRAEAVVVDVRAQAARSADYAVSVADLEAWERAHGPMPEHALVVMASGWDARWPDETRYRNRDAKGDMHFPGFSVEAIAWLLAHHPGFVGVGVDTMSIDPGASPNFAAHRKLLGAGKYGVENLAGVATLPARGATVVVAPLKLAGGSGAPARVFADVPK